MLIIFPEKIQEFLVHNAYENNDKRLEENIAKFLKKELCFSCNRTLRSVQSISVMNTYFPLSKLPLDEEISVPELRMHFLLFQTQLDF